MREKPEEFSAPVDEASARVLILVRPRLLLFSAPFVSVLAMKEEEIALVENTRIHSNLAKQVKVMGKKFVAQSLVSSPSVEFVNFLESLHRKEVEEPSRKRHRTSLEIFPEKVDHSVLVLVEEKVVQSTFATILVDRLSERFPCLAISLVAPGSRRRKACVLGAEHQQKLTQAKLILAEDQVLAALRAEQKLQTGSNIFGVPCLNQWRNKLSLRLPMLPHRDLLKTAYDEAVQMIWKEKFMVLVPVKSLYLERHGVSQMVISTEEDVDLILNQPTMSSVRVRAWGFGPSQGLELWKKVKRFDPVDNTVEEMPESLRTLGKVPTLTKAPTTEEADFYDGLILLHDADAGVLAREKAELGAEAVGIHGDLSSLEKLRKTAALARKITSKASGVILKDAFCEKYGSLLVAEGTPVLNWSSGHETRFGFAREHQARSGVYLHPTDSGEDEKDQDETSDEDQIPEDIDDSCLPELVKSRLESKKQSKKVLDAVEITKARCNNLHLDPANLQTFLEAAHFKAVVGRVTDTYLSSFLFYLEEIPLTYARFEARRISHERGSAFAQQTLMVKVGPSLHDIHNFVNDLLERTGKVPGPKEALLSREKALAFYGAWTWSPPGYDGTLTQKAVLDPKTFLEEAEHRSRHSLNLANALKDMTWCKYAPLVVEKLLERGHGRRSDHNLRWISKLKGLVTASSTTTLVSWATSNGTVSGLLKELESL